MLLALALLAPASYPAQSGGAAGAGRPSAVPAARSPDAWPRPPLVARRIATINDTHVEGGIWLQGGAPRALQLELHVDPADHLDWGPGGPTVRVACTDPHAREGYAADFSGLWQAHGPQFVAVTRAGRHGLVLMRLELGRDLPLGQDLRCRVVFLEWLLERPSTLYLVDADVDMPAPTAP